MGVISDSAVSDDLARRLRTLERQVASLQTALRLEAATIGKGGLRIKDEGVATFEDGGGVVINDGGTIQLNDGGSVELNDGGGVNVNDGGDILQEGGRYRANDSQGERVFEVVSEPASIFMDPSLIAEISAQALNFRIESALTVTSGTLDDTDLLFHDLDTGGTGPSVTVPVSETGVAIVTFGALMSWQDLSGAASIMGGGVGFEVSGATTRAPTVDEEFGFAAAVVANGSAQIKGVNQITVSGLNPGNNTFTLKYRNRDLDRFTDFQSRQISVIGL